MNIVLFDNEKVKNFWPLTYNKPLAHLRTGILTIEERWKFKTKEKVSVYSFSEENNLQDVNLEDDLIWVDSSVIIYGDILEKIISLESNSFLIDEVGFIAGRNKFSVIPKSIQSLYESFSQKIEIKNSKRLEYPWQIFQWADRTINEDFTIVTEGKYSQKIPESTIVFGSNSIFIEEGASLECCYLNATNGPIYIGKEATIMEGSVVRGPFALCDNATLKMGSKVYGATSLGPYCVGGGEIKNVIMMGYSNKAHEGYLGDSIIGEWCNLGAGTSCSNVKNTGGEIKLKDNTTNEQVIVGQKCGVIMGDYSRTAINTSINSGTTIGVCCNVFGEGLLPKNIENFTWGATEKKSYEFEKALADINNWKAMKHLEITKQEVETLKFIYNNY